MAVRKLRPPILIGGLIAGVLDITYAFVFGYIRVVEQVPIALVDRHYSK